MITAKRIGLSVLDSELLNLINASAKIFPITQSDITSSLNPNNYEYGKLYIDTDKTTYLYRWQDTEWKLIGADDKNIDWGDVKNKPVEYKPMPHNHPASEISGLPTYNIPTDTNQLTKSDVYTKTEVNNALATKSSLEHDHNTVYALLLHDHDGRYATLSLLATKAPLEHDHNALYQPKGNYAPFEHDHNTVYASKSVESQVSTNTQNISAIQTNMANGDMHSNISVLNQLTQVLLDAWNSAVTHISDAVKHITSAERTLWNTVSNKANATHAHNASTDITEDSTHRFVTDTDKTNWNGKADSTTLTGHTGNTTIHVTQTDKDTWNAKQASITGGASTITSSNLTTSRALVSDTSGKVAVSAVTSTELGYVSGVTSSVQTQLNAKQKAITVSTTAPSSPATNDLWIDLN